MTDRGSTSVGVADAGTSVLGSLVGVGALVGAIRVGDAGMGDAVTGRIATADGGTATGGALHAANPTLIIKPQTIYFRRSINTSPLLKSTSLIFRQPTRIFAIRRKR